MRPLYEVPKPFVKRDLLSKTFEVVCEVIGRNSTELETYLADLQKQGRPAPSFGLQTAPDPRIYDCGRHYRDALRTQLDCVGHQMQIYRIGWRIEETQPAYKDVILFHQSYNHRPWQDMRKRFETEPGPFKFVLDMGTAEDDEDIMETNLPPIKLEELYNLVDGNPTSEGDEEGEDVAAGA